MIKLVKCNLAGLPVGEDNHACKYPDDLVAQARRMRADGMTLKAISAELGPCFQTIHDYVTNRRRNPPAKVVARRVKTRTTDHQSSVNQEAMRVSGDMRNPTRTATPKTDHESEFHDLA